MANDVSRLQFSYPSEMIAEKYKEIVQRPLGCKLPKALFAIIKAIGYLALSIFVGLPSLCCSTTNLKYYTFTAVRNLQAAGGYLIAIFNHRGGHYLTLAVVHIDLYKQNKDKKTKQQEELLATVNQLIKERNFEALGKIKGLTGKKIRNEKRRDFITQCLSSKYDHLKLARECALQMEGKPKYRDAILITAILRYTQQNNLELVVQTLKEILDVKFNDKKAPLSENCKAAPLYSRVKSKLNEHRLAVARNAIEAASRQDQVIKELIKIIDKYVSEFIQA